MLRQHSPKVTLIVGVLFLCLAFEAFSRTNDNKPKLTTKDRKTFKLQVEVTAGDSAEKVDGVKVDVESKEDGIKFSKGVTTNKAGVATISQVPQGKLRIQLVVRQFETFGQDYTVTDDNQTIKILLKKRSDQ